MLFGFMCCKTSQHRCEKKRSFWLIVATEVEDLEVYFVYKQVLGRSSRCELLEHLAGGCSVPKPATESVFDLW